MRIRFPSLLIVSCLLCGIPWPAGNAATLQITELTDIEFGEVPTSARRVRERMRFCVSMSPAGPYQLTAFGTVNGNSFALLDPNNAAPPIRFDVQLRGAGSGRRGRNMQPGIPLRNLRGQRPRPDGGCRRAGQLQIQVQINNQDLAAAPSGSYRGQLQLTVAPE